MANSPKCRPSGPKYLFCQLSGACTAPATKSEWPSRAGVSLLQITHFPCDCLLRTQCFFRYFSGGEGGSALDADRLRGRGGADGEAGVGAAGGGDGGADD